MIKINSGNLIETKITIDFVIYIASDKQYEYSDLSELSKSYTDLKTTDVFIEENNSVFLELINNIQEIAPIVPIESINYYSKGILETEYSQLYKINNALHLALTYDPSKEVFIYQQFLEYIYRLASTTQGYIWDDEARLLYSHEYWNKNITTSFHNNYADIRNHISIHQYQVDTTVRSVTLGLRKFGIPDLVIQSSPRYHSPQNANILTIIGQYLHENPELSLDGSFLLEAINIKNNFEKEKIEENSLPNAIGKGTILFETGIWEDGDPQNRLWSIFFNNYSNKIIYENQSEFYSKFFGSSDEVTEVKHKDELLIASEEAKKEFNKLYTKFNNDMKPGENILVKAPFITSTGSNEWMWVEITDWSGELITGILQNDPYEVPNLEAGAIVEVKKESIFDYIFYKADGTYEGNETGKIIEEMNKS